MISGLRKAALGRIGLYNVAVIDHSLSRRRLARRSDTGRVDHVEAVRFPVGRQSYVLGEVEGRRCGERCAFPQPADEIVARAGRIGDLRPRSVVFHRLDFVFFTVALDVGHGVFVGFPYRIEVGVADGIIVGDGIVLVVVDSRAVGSGRPARERVARAGEDAQRLKRYSRVEDDLLCADGLVARNVIVIRDHVGLRRPLGGKGIRGGLGTEGVLAVGQRAVAAGAGPAVEVVAVAHGLGHGEFRAVAAGVFRRGGDLGAVHGHRAAVRVEGDLALVDRPVRVDGSRSGALEYGFAGNDLRAAGLGGEPAVEVIAGQGGIGKLGLVVERGGPHGVIGRGRGLRGGRAAVAVVDDGVGLGRPGGRQGIDGALGLAEGIDAGLVRAFRERGADVGRVGRQGPAGEVVAGLFGLVEGSGLAVDAGDFLIVGVAIQRAAVQDELDLAGIRLGSGERDGGVGSEAGQGVGVFAGLRDGDRGGGGHEIACRMMVAGVDGERDGVRAVVVHEGRALDRGSDGDGLARVVHEGDAVGVDLGVAELDDDVAGRGGCDVHADVRIIGLRERHDAVVRGNGRGDVGGKRLAVAVLERDLEGVAAEIDDALHGLGGQGVAGQVVLAFGGADERDGVGLLLGRDGEDDVLGHRVGDGERVGRAFAGNSEVHRGRGADAGLVEIIAVLHCDAHVRVLRVVVLDGRGRGRADEGVVALDHGQGQVEQVAAGERDDVIVSHAGDGHGHDVAGDARGKGHAAGHVNDEVVDVVAGICGDGEGVGIVVILIGERADGVTGQLVAPNGVSDLLPLRVEGDALFEEVGRDLALPRAVLIAVVVAAVRERVAEEGAADSHRRRDRGERFAVGGGQALRAGLGQGGPGGGRRAGIEGDGEGLHLPLGDKGVRARAVAEGVGVDVERTVEVAVPRGSFPAVEVVARAGGQRGDLIGGAGGAGSGDRKDRVVLRIQTEVSFAVVHGEHDGVLVDLGVLQSDDDVAGHVADRVGPSLGRGEGLIGARGRHADQNGAGVGVSVLERDAEGHVLAVDDGGLHLGTVVTVDGGVERAVLMHKRDVIDVLLRLAERDDDVAFVEAVDLEGDHVAGLGDVSDVARAGDADVEVVELGLGVAGIERDGVGHFAAVVDELLLIRGGRNGVADLVPFLGHDLDGEVLSLPLGVEVDDRAVHGGQVELFDGCAGRVARAGVLAGGSVVARVPGGDLIACAVEVILRRQRDGGVVGVVVGIELVGGLSVAGHVVDLVVMRIVDRLQRVVRLGLVAEGVGIGRSDVGGVVAFLRFELPVIEGVADLLGRAEAGLHRAGILIPGGLARDGAAVEIQCQRGLVLQPLRGDGDRIVRIVDFHAVGHEVRGSDGGVRRDGSLADLPAVESPAGAGEGVFGLPRAVDGLHGHRGKRNGAGGIAVHEGDGVLDGRPVRGEGDLKIAVRIVVDQEGIRDLGHAGSIGAAAERPVVEEVAVASEAVLCELCARMVGVDHGLVGRGARAAVGVVMQDVFVGLPLRGENDGGVVIVAEDLRVRQNVTLVIRIPAAVLPVDEVVAGARVVVRTVVDCGIVVRVVIHVLRGGLGADEARAGAGGVGHDDVAGFPLGVDGDVGGDRLRSAVHAVEGGEIGVLIPAEEDVTGLHGQRQDDVARLPDRVKRVHAVGVIILVRVRRQRSADAVAGGRIPVGVPVPQRKVHSLGSDRRAAVDVVGHGVAAGEVIGLAVLVVIERGRDVVGIGLLMVRAHAAVGIVGHDVGVLLPHGVESDVAGGGVSVVPQRVVRVAGEGVLGALGISGGGGTCAEGPAEEGVALAGRFVGGQAEGLVVGRIERRGGVHAAVGVVDHLVGHGVPDGVKRDVAVFAVDVEVAVVGAGGPVRALGRGSKVPVPEDVAFLHGRAERGIGIGDVIGLRPRGGLVHAGLGIGEGDGIFRDLPDSGENDLVGGVRVRKEPGAVHGSRIRGVIADGGIPVVEVPAGLREGVGRQGAGLLVVEGLRLHGTGAAFARRKTDGEGLGRPLGIDVGVGGNGRTGGELVCKSAVVREPAAEVVACLFGRGQSHGAERPDRIEVVAAGLDEVGRGERRAGVQAVGIIHGGVRVVVPLGERRGRGVARGPVAGGGPIIMVCHGVAAGERSVARKGDVGIVGDRVGSDRRIRRIVGVIDDRVLLRAPDGVEGDGVSRRLRAVGKLVVRERLPRVIVLGSRCAVSGPAEEDVAGLLRDGGGQRHGLIVGGGNIGKGAGAALEVKGHGVGDRGPVRGDGDLKVFVRVVNKEGIRDLGLVRRIRIGAERPVVELVTCARVAVGGELRPRVFAVGHGLVSRGAGAVVRGVMDGVDVARPLRGEGDLVGGVGVLEQPRAGHGEVGRHVVAVLILPAGEVPAGLREGVRGEGACGLFIVEGLVAHRARGAVAGKVADSELLGLPLGVEDKILGDRGTVLVEGSRQPGVGIPAAEDVTGLFGRGQRAGDLVVGPDGIERCRAVLNVILISVGGARSVGVVQHRAGVLAGGRGG